MEKRKSGLRDPFQGIEELDFSTFVAPYTHFLEDYKENLYLIRKKKNGFAYLVTYVDEPDLFFITFEKNKDRAKGTATKYFKENLHPNFIGRLWREKYNKCRAIKVKEFDQYAERKKVPIDELMRVLEVKVSCSACGEGNFSYEDLKIKRCFKVEGFGDFNVFTQDFVLCRECYNKFMNQ